MTNFLIFFICVCTNEETKSEITSNQINQTLLIEANLTYPNLTHEIPASTLLGVHWVPTECDTDLDSRREMTFLSQF